MGWPPKIKSTCLGGTQQGQVPHTPWCHRSHPDRRTRGSPGQPLACPRGSAHRSHRPCRPPAAAARRPRSWPSTAQGERNRVGDGSGDTPVAGKGPQGPRQLTCDQAPVLHCAGQGRRPQGRRVSGRSPLQYLACRVRLVPSRRRCTHCTARACSPSLPQDLLQAPHSSATQLQGSGAVLVAGREKPLLAAVQPQIVQ